MDQKPFDLEPRTFAFAADVRKFVRLLQKDFVSYEDAKQLVRASGSVGANYIEANEALSRKDFLMRIKICRKEAKEAEYWLKLISDCSGQQVEHMRRKLQQEAKKLRHIFGSIVAKCG